MNLGHASIVLRHRSPLEVVDLAIRFVRALAPTRYFWLSIALVLPGWALCVIMKSLGLNWLWVWVIAIVLSRVLELPFLILSGKLLFDKETSLASVLRESRLRFISYIWGHILYSLLFTASLCLIVAPLFVGATYVFLPEILTLERTSGLKAFKRSRAFLSEKSGVGLEVYMIRLIVLSGFVVLTDAIGQALVQYVFLVFGNFDSLWEEGGSVFGLLGLFLFVPYGATYRYLSYINERTVRDGWDIQVAFLKLASFNGVFVRRKGAEVEA